MSTYQPPKTIGMMYVGPEDYGPSAQVSGLRIDPRMPGESWGAYANGHIPGLCVVGGGVLLAFAKTRKWGLGLVVLGLVLLFIEKQIGHKVAIPMAGDYGISTAPPAVPNLYLM